MQRAYQTALPISKLFGLPIHTEEDFKKINGGAWEEKKPEEILRLYRNANALWLKDIRLARCTGGENMQEVQNRAIKALKKSFIITPLKFSAFLLY